jgi:putative acetyltransferase
VPDFSIRQETSIDFARVDEIQQAAFGQPQEAELVRALRSAAQPQLSLVAELAGQIVGHVFFSPVRIDGDAASPSLGGLAPLAVDPEQQGRGAGSALVCAGLEACRPLGWQAIFLLGNPAYYSRFGFELAAPRGFHYESAAFDVAFQLLELVPGALADKSGWILYHSAFEDL